MKTHVSELEIKTRIVSEAKHFINQPYLNSLYEKIFFFTFKRVKAIDNSKVHLWKLMNKAEVIPRKYIIIN